MSDAKNAIKRNLCFIKNKVRKVEINGKEQILISYARSLMIFYATPLVAAKMLRKEDITRLEEQFLREIYVRPRDIKGSLIRNVAENVKPAWPSIQNLAKEVNTYHSR